MQKSSVASFPLWSLQKQNSSVKGENNMKNIVGISVITYWRFYLRWWTWYKSAILLKMWKSMVLKMWMKCKFALCQPGYYNLLTEKNIRKFMFLKYSFFWRRTSISRNSLEAPLLNNIFFGNFTLSNSIILVEDLKRWNRGFWLNINKINKYF